MTKITQLAFAVGMFIGALLYWLTNVVWSWWVNSEALVVGMGTVAVIALVRMATPDSQPEPDPPTARPPKHGEHDG